jgi:putative amide transporter protein
MGNIALFLSGAVLFLNSLMLLGKAEAKSVGYFNLFIGTIQMFLPFCIILTSEQTNWDFYHSAPIFLFGLTYLYVGFTTLKNLDGNSLGWFCLWVAIVAAVYSVIAFIQFNDVVNGLTWAMWVLLWFIFFLSNTLKKKIDQYVGYVAFIQSWVTLTVPALLYFIGVWNTPIVVQIWSIVLIVSIISFIVLPFILNHSLKKELPIGYQAPSMDN